MSKADELFKELGYRIEKRFYGDTYLNNGKEINYKNTFKEIIINDMPITMQELKAINEKCKELEWLDE